ncbi:hypothetical protein BDV95DRAFT_597638 [Massariosphaeria phaeospora]|uniref:Uncharacterized protein n=1 Tax=Massariosphaeria phaeospora TaxID=100035 RepID=A0A7C8I4C0_9PLEO|nr:hypothetical protein BDV95DRAFT_597638 [Massariosphaeria phaeospora]
MAATTPTLLSLPRELRDHIYTLVFSPPTNPPQQAASHPPSPVAGQPDHNTALLSHDPFDRCYTSLFNDIDLEAEEESVPVISGHNHRTLYESLPPIILTCSQLHLETTPVYLRLKSCTVFFEDATSLIFLLSWLESFGNEAFSNIRSLHFDEYSKSSVKLNLSIITRCTNLRELQLRMRIDPHLKCTTGSLQTVIYDFALAKLLELPMLEILVLHFPEGIHEVERRKWHYSMRGWFVNQWSMRGRMVVVDHKLKPRVEGDESSSDSEFAGCTMFD